MTSADKFFAIVRHPLKFRLFLLAKLPSAFFSGVRVRYADEQKCIVTVPYKWFTKNPFHSTYFACHSMAAEMSTGVLAMAHTFEQEPPISMLVLKIEGNFTKKATALSSYTCEDGLFVKKAIREAAAGGKSTTATLRSLGINKAGEPVAEFFITWSFKLKTQ